MNEQNQQYRYHHTQKHQKYTSDDLTFVHKDQPTMDYNNDVPEYLRVIRRIENRSNVVCEETLEQVIYLIEKYSIVVLPYLKDVFREIVEWVKEEGIGWMERKRREGQLWMQRNAGREREYWQREEKKSNIGKDNKNKNNKNIKNNDKNKYNSNKINNQPYHIQPLSYFYQSPPSSQHFYNFSNNNQQQSQPTKQSSFNSKIIIPKCLLQKLYALLYHIFPENNPNSLQNFLLHTTNSKLKLFKQPQKHRVQKPQYDSVLEHVFKEAVLLKMIIEQSLQKLGMFSNKSKKQAIKGGIYDGSGNYMQKIAKKYQPPSTFINFIFKIYNINDKDQFYKQFKQHFQKNNNHQNNNFSDSSSSPFSHAQAQFIKSDQQLYDFRQLMEMIQTYFLLLFKQDAEMIEQEALYLIEKWTENNGDDRVLSEESILKQYFGNSQSYKKNSIIKIKDSNQSPPFQLYSSLPSYSFITNTNSQIQLSNLYQQRNCTTPPIIMLKLSSHLQHGPFSSFKSVEKSKKQQKSEQKLKQQTDIKIQQKIIKDLIFSLMNNDEGGSVLFVNAFNFNKQVKQQKHFLEKLIARLLKQEERQFEMEYMKNVQYRVEMIQVEGTPIDGSQVDYKLIRNSKNGGISKYLPIVHIKNKSPSILYYKIVTPRSQQNPNNQTTLILNNKFSFSYSSPTISSSKSHLYCLTLSHNSITSLSHQQILQTKASKNFLYQIFNHEKNKNKYYQAGRILNNLSKNNKLSYIQGRRYQQGKPGQYE